VRQIWDYSRPQSVRIRLDSEGLARVASNSGNIEATVNLQMSRWVFASQKRTLARSAVCYAFRAAEQGSGAAPIAA
jgi:hypothetical protein